MTARRYVPPAGAPRAVIVDLDGTVALRTGDRSPYDWQRVGEDEPNLPVIELVQVLAKAGFRIIGMSGRDEECYRQSESWLLHHGVPVDELWMRRRKDNRSDDVVKLELFDRHVRDRYDVAWVIDDRDQVVKAWRSIGLTVLQVAEGDF